MTESGTIKETAQKKDLVKKSKANSKEVIATMESTEQVKNLTNAKIEGVLEEQPEKSLNEIFNFENKSKGNPDPQYGTGDNMAMLIHADLNKGFTRIPAGDIALVPTGIHATIPAGFELQVRTNQQLLIKEKLVVFAASVDFTGEKEIIVPVFNASTIEKMIKHSDPIAELVLVYTPTPEFNSKK